MVVIWPRPVKIRRCAFGILLELVADDVGGAPPDFEVPRCPGVCELGGRSCTVAQEPLVFAGVGWCGWNGVFVGCRDLVGEGEDSRWTCYATLDHSSFSHFEPMDDNDKTTSVRVAIH
jgi:hypothetical protein